MSVQLTTRDHEVQGLVLERNQYKKTNELLQAQLIDSLSRNYKKDRKLKYDNISESASDRIEFNSSRNELGKGGSTSTESEGDSMNINHEEDEDNSNEDIDDDDEDEIEGIEVTSNVLKDLLTEARLELAQQKLVTADVTNSCKELEMKVVELKMQLACMSEERADMIHMKEVVSSLLGGGGGGR